MRGINMSYCAIENTSMALAQVLELLQDHLEESSASEQRSWGRLVDAARTIMDLSFACFILAIRLRGNGLVSYENYWI